MSASLQHQALHGWGIVWCCSSWLLRCIIRPTILVEASWCLWVKASHCYYFFWEISYTWYWRWPCLPPSLWSLLSNVVRSSPRLGNLFSFLFSMKVRGRSWPHPWSLGRVPPHNISRWIRSWKNTGISSPHPQGYPCTVMSSIRSIWLREHLYPTSKYIATPLWKMKGLRDKS